MINTGANSSRKIGKVIIIETKQMVITDWLAVHTVQLQLTLQVTEVAKSKRSLDIFATGKCF